MIKAQEFSNRLMAWSQANQKLNEWSERHPVTSEVDDGGREEFVELRRKLYQSEWHLVSSGARREVWEAGTPHWLGDDERHVLENLRSSVTDLNFSRDGYFADAPAGSVNAWWFLPYAVWVGNLPSQRGAAAQQLEMVLERTLEGFKTHLQPQMVQAFDEGLKGMSDFEGCQMAIFQTFDATVLRDFPLPSLHYSQWEPDSQRAVLFNVADPSPYRKGCIAFYFQGPDYANVAMMRDVVHQVALEGLADINGPDIQFGVLQSRSLATESAELLAWDMWGESITGDELMPGATHRDIRLKVFQQAGRPRTLLAHYREMKGEDVLNEGTFKCELFESDMLFDALEVFIECTRPEIHWSVERIDVSPNGG